MSDRDLETSPVWGAYGLGVMFRVLGLGFKFRVKGFRFRVQGLGFRSLGFLDPKP